MVYIKWWLFIVVMMILSFAGAFILQGVFMPILVGLALFLYAVGVCGQSGISRYQMPMVKKGGTMTPFLDTPKQLDR